MKSGIYKLIFIIALSLTAYSCNTDDDNNTNQDFNGTYNGTFTVEYANGETFSNPVIVSFTKENAYQSSQNNDFFPAGGNGTYEKGNSTINFTDINFWLANFDWNLILDGKYNYSKNGNKLIISANKNNVGF